jgi:hypothetical protein
MGAVVTDRGLDQLSTIRGSHSISVEGGSRLNIRVLGSLEVDDDHGRAVGSAAPMRRGC